MKASDVEATKIKETGNQYFRNQDFSKAILSYTRALNFECTRTLQISLYLNRASCYLALKDFIFAINDCKRTIELDPKNVKAHFLFGRCSIGLSDLYEARKQFNKALSLCEIGDKEHQDMIKPYLLKTKKQIYISEQNEKFETEKKLFKYTMSIMESYEASSGSISEIHNTMKMKLESFFEERLSTYDTSLKSQVIPADLTCPVTLDLMKNPVICTCSGISYEKEALLEHIKTNGSFCPITRKPIDDYQKDIVENVNLRNFIQQFMADNPWSYSS